MEDYELTNLRKTNPDSLVLKMVEIIDRAHDGQMYGDKHYVWHLWDVFYKTVEIGHSNEIYACTALGHDLIEDTDWTTKDLLQAGFPHEVVDAIESVSKRENESYNEYIRRVKSNEIGLVIKRADTKANLDQSFKDQDPKRIKKYARQLEKLYKD